MPPAHYEYLFIRLDVGQVWTTGSTVPTQEARESYQGVVHEHAAEGWRLAQIFAPGLGPYGTASYFELIFERERPAAG